MKVEVVQGAKEREGEEMERLIQSASFSLCSVAKIHTAAEICFSCHLLSIFRCLFFDSRFTVLVSSLASVPQTLNNTTAQSVKPLWWSNTSEEVRCEMCDIQSPVWLFACQLVQTDPQIIAQLFSKVLSFWENLWKDSGTQAAESIAIKCDPFFFQGRPSL